MTAIVTIGIDLAKNVFDLDGVEPRDNHALVRPTVPRSKLLELIASLPPCLIGMEACSGALRWAPEFQKFGHTVRLMALKFLTCYDIRCLLRMIAKKEETFLAARLLRLCQLIGISPNLALMQRNFAFNESRAPALRLTAG